MRKEKLTDIWTPEEREGKESSVVARLNGGEDSSNTTADVVVDTRTCQECHINHNWLSAKEGNFPLFAVLLGFPAAGDSPSLARGAVGAAPARAALAPALSSGAKH